MFFSITHNFKQLYSFTVVNINRVQIKCSIFKYLSRRILIDSWDHGTAQMTATKMSLGSLEIG